MAYCAYCRSHVLDTDHKCPSCGSTAFIQEEKPKPQVVYVEKPVERTVYVEKPVERTVYVERPVVSRYNRWAAFVLCILLGWLGVHRFYVGKTGSGILYMFTCGLFGIGIAVDALVLLFGHFRDARGLPLAS